MQFIIELLLRLLMFGISLFFLLEYIVLCKVETKNALIGLTFTILVVLILFIFLNNYRVIELCNSCGKSYYKK